MAFQERNGTCGMKPERSGQNLAEKSGMDWDLKWDENCFILFCFLNWYEMFRPFRAKRNGIDNLERNGLSAPHYNVLYRECDVMMNLMASKMTSIGTWRKAHTPPKGNGHSLCYALISIFHLFFQFSPIFLNFVFSRFGTLPSF